MHAATLFSALVTFVGLATANLGDSRTHLQTRALATLYSKCTGTKQVALTFDDGPYIWDGTLQANLAKYNVSATFFVNVKNWACSYEPSIVASTRALFQAGHEFGSHTYAHKDLSTLSFDKVHDEMYKAELYLQRVLGVHPAMMRPPYGAYNDNVRNVSARRNQSMILWDFASGDADGYTVEKSKALYLDLVNRKVKNVLALNHDTYNGTVSEIVPYALDLFSKANYTFVTVSECLGIEPYQWQQPFGVRNSSWVCT